MIYYFNFFDNPEYRTNFLELLETLENTLKEIDIYKLLNTLKENDVEIFDEDDINE